MTADYIKLVRLVDRAHRQFMELVQVELTKRLQEPAITPVQAMILMNLADQEMTVGEFTQRGCYLGTKISHHLDKMLESGHIERRKSDNDKRLILVRATEKGRLLQDRLSAAFAAHAERMTRQTSLQDDRLPELVSSLSAARDFWAEMSKPPVFRAIA